MTDEELSWDKSIFRDEHVFELDYVPEVFLHREEQLETLKYALRPATRGSRPLNVSLRGPPGTGKTTSIHKIFAELDTQSNVRAVRINCQMNSTRYSIFKSIFDKTIGFESPPQSIQFEKLFRKIANKMISDEMILVVALDDVSYLYFNNEASDTLYTLLRAHEEFEGFKTGVVIVTSDLDLEVRESLDQRVQSVFRPERVFYPEYDLIEVQDILQKRVETGFRKGVVSSEVLEEVVERTADAGDLRVGIDLLRRSGLNAEMRGAQEINRQDVIDAHEDIQDID